VEEHAISTQVLKDNITKDDLSDFAGKTSFRHLWRDDDSGYSGGYATSGARKTGA
jgi:hypothetical protein